MRINILFPVLNEQLRLEKGILNTIEYLDKNTDCYYEITIVDNGSEDQTANISKRLCQKYNHVKYIRTIERGVGLAFREGVKQNTCEIIGYMDVDLSTDIKHLKEVIEIFTKEESVGIVNGSRFNKKSITIGRKWYRNLTSWGLTLLLKLFLQMKATDSICGFKFFRKEIAEKLVANSSDEKGWFYIIELLLRAEKRKIKIVELPVIWKDDYNTKVKIFKLIKNYLTQIIRLFVELNIRKKV